MISKRIVTTFAAVGILFLLCGSNAAEEKKNSPTVKTPEPASIKATETVTDTHPEIEEGITCADCHEVVVDANTTATEFWISKDYRNWSAGEGIESNQDTKKHIIDVLGGKKTKKTYMLATCINNNPIATTIEYALDPDKMIMYGFSEKNTEKLFHIKANPRVSLGWHEEFTVFGKTLCVQIRGSAEVVDDPAKYDEGLALYPYEYAADAIKLDHKKFADEMIRKNMTMTKITITQIVIIDSKYGSEKGVRGTHIWKRGK